MEYSGDQRYPDLHRNPTGHYRFPYSRDDWEDGENFYEDYDDYNGRGRPSVRSTEHSPQPLTNRTRSLSPFSEEEDDKVPDNDDATVQEEVIYIGTMVERAKSKGLSMDVNLKGGNKDSNVAIGIGDNSKSEQAWKESKTQLEEIGTTHLQSIYALEYSVSEGNVVLFCPKGPPREGDAELVQVRWLHIERRTMSLKVFDKLIMNCPFINDDLRTVAVTLLEAIQGKFVRDSENGPYIDPGFVLRATGCHPEYSDRSYQPGSVTHPVIFVASPYLSMKSLKSQRGASNDDEFHPRTLLQSLYGFDVVSNRDKQQVVRKMSTRSQSNEVLHIDQTWCLLLGSDVIITMSDQGIDEVGGGIIEKRACLPEKPITLRIFDANRCIHNIVLPENISWVDFFRYIVVLSEGKVSDAMNYDLVDENNEVITGERWIESMKVPTQRLHWSLVKKKEKSSSRSQSRTSQSSSRSAGRELRMIDNRPYNFSETADDMSDQRSSIYISSVLPEEYNYDDWAMLLGKRRGNREYDRSESQDTQQSSSMGYRRSPEYAWENEDDRNSFWDVRTLRSETSEPRRPIHAVADQRRLITYPNRRQSVDELPQQRGCKERSSHNSQTFLSKQVSNAGKTVADQPPSPERAVNTKTPSNAQENPSRDENYNKFRGYRKPTASSVSSDSGEKASFSDFTGGVEGEENTTAGADEIESTRRDVFSSPDQFSDVEYENSTDSDEQKEQTQKAGDKYSQHSDRDTTTVVDVLANKTHQANDSKDQRSETISENDINDSENMNEASSDGAHDADTSTLSASESENPEKRLREKPKVVRYVEDDNPSEETEWAKRNSPLNYIERERQVRQPSPVRSDMLQRLRRRFDRKNRGSSQSSQDGPASQQYFDNEDHVSRVANRRLPLRRRHYPDSPPPVPSSGLSMGGPISQDNNTRYSGPAEMSYNKDPTANDGPYREVRFAAEDDYYSDENRASSRDESLRTTPNSGLSFEVTIPFFHWPSQSTVAMEGTETIDEAMIKLLSRIDKSMSADRIGRYYEAIPECSMEDFFLRQEFLDGILPDGDLKLIGDDGRISLDDSSGAHEKEKGGASEGPKTDDGSTPNTQDNDTQDNDGQPAQSDAGQKTESAKIEPEGAEWKQAQSIGIISHDKALMKQLVDVSRQLAWAFIPREGGAMIHVLLKRFWGSLDILCRQLIWEENERGPDDGCAYFIRDFSSHFQRMDPATRAESSTNFSWNACTDCKTAKHYSSVKEALEHLHVKHLDCAGEFERPFDDPCYVWLHHIWHVSYAPRAPRDGFLANMEDFISDLHRINRYVKELHIMVTDSATDLGSTRPPLPGAVLSAFQQIIKIFVLHSKTLSLMNRRRDSVLHDVRNGHLLNRINAKIQELSALESTEIERAIDLLGTAKRDIFLSGNTSRDIERLQPQTVGAEFLALAIICAGQNLPLRSVQQTWRYKEDLFIKLYKDYTSQMHYQANRRPQKRVFLDIRYLEEELGALGKLLVDQENCLIKYTYVVNPKTLHYSTRTRTSQYQTDSAYRDKQLQQLERRKRDIDNMKTRSKFLKEQVKQTIEIMEEDHGKAIRVFTIVTLFFLPLSFVSSYMGMNTADVRDMEYNQQIFWISAIPITVFVVVLAFIYGYKGDEIHDWVVQRLENSRFKRLTADDHYKMVHPLRGDKLKMMTPTPSALELTGHRGYKASTGHISRQTSGRPSGNEAKTRISDKPEPWQPRLKRTIKRQDTWDSLAPLR